MTQAKVRHEALKDAGSKAAKGLDEVSVAATKATGAFGLAGYQIRNLTAQVVDFSVQVLSGGGLFYPIIQQGPQAVDAVGGLKSALSILGQILTPTRLLVGGLAVAIVGSVAAAEQQERALLSLSTRLRATRADYATLAQAVDVNARVLAGSTDLSTSDASAAGVTLGGVSTYAGTQQDLRRLQQVAGDVAVMLGTTVPQAAEKMAAGLRRPAETARQLAASDLRTLDDATLRTIESLDNLGRRAEAGAVLMDALSRAAGSATDAQTPFQRSLSEAEQAATRVWNAIRPLIVGLGTDLVHSIASGIEGIASLITKLQELSDSFSNSAIGKFLLSADSGPAAFLNRFAGVEGTGPRIIDHSTGQVVPTGSLTNTSSASDIQAYIRQSVAGTNVPADFALAVAGRESGYRQQVNGRTLASSSGALGTMQLMPATAAGLGVDPNDAAQNIAGGIRYLGQLLEKYGGDQSLAAAAYNAGPGRVDKFLAGKATLPQETWDYVRAVAPNRTENGVVVASGGALSSQAEVLGIANERVRAANVLPDQIRTANEKIAQTRSALATPGLDTESQARYNALLRDQLAALDALKTPEQRRQQDFQDRTAIMAEAAGAARDLKQAEMAEVRQAEAEGHAPDIAGARARKQSELNDALVDTVRQVGLDTDAQVARNRVILQGNAAVQDAAVVAKAQTDALKYGAEGTADYTNAVQTLTRVYRAQQAQVNAGALLGSIKDTEQANEQLQLETSLITANTVEREKAIAAYKTERQIREAGADGTPEADRLRAASQQAAELRVQNQQLAASWQELQSFGTQAFDRIGEAVTEAFVNGKDSAVSFASVAKALLSEVIQLMLKLALINPLQNAVLGTNLGTLGGIGSLLGGTASAAPAVLGASGGAIGYVTDAGKVVTATGGSSGGLLSGLSSLASVGSITSGLSKIGGFLGIGGGAATAATSASATAAGMGTGGAFALDMSGGAASSAMAATAPTSFLGMTGTGAWLGGAGIGIGGGLLANSLLGGNKTNGMIGTGIGTAVGAFGGPVGMAIGGTIGGALGGLFGARPSDKTGTYSMDLVSGVGTEGGLEGKKFSQENRDSAKTISDSISSMAEQLRTALGVSTTPLAYQVAVGGRDGLSLQYADGQKFSYDASDSGTTALVKQAAQDIVKSMASAASSEIQSIIAHSDDADTLLSNVQWFTGTYKVLSGTIEQNQNAAQRFQASLDTLTKPFDDAIAKASQLGLETAKLAENQAAAVAAAQATQTDTYDAARRTAQGRDYITQLSGVRTYYNDNAALMRQLGRDPEGMYVDQAVAILNQLNESQLEDVTKAFTGWDDAIVSLAAQTLANARATEAATAAQEAAATATSDQLSALQKLQSQSKVLTGYLDSQALNDNTLSPSAKLTEAQRQFSAAVDAARAAGPANADLSAVTSAASAVEQAGLLNYASSPQQAMLVQGIRSTVENLAIGLGLPDFTDSLDQSLAVAQAQLAVQQDQKALLQQLIAEIRQDRLERKAS
ncbi:transglycosylase SLT domain-containing protein [Roseomonas elaeocarpi]|uniref:Transglycosylase SLT domain-containing protein n=1 Tax=Roseomonas elaeocarpi TaxID=907779 RepID=A0ABV6JZ05_9PROT